ncbi:hypothetical protein D9613_007947 [Agrocybe pediades]|uniref:Major facilitator superfamily (MFS) profile domain-containing protein n=1 Tax=Agrocybe pediades TaxID=84607 RepID=A0A8H4QNK4_9AGAR|nr:hypothetical protein D9613_007947 [Agrocybe pediades]
MLSFSKKPTTPILSHTRPELVDNDSDTSSVTRTNDDDVDRLTKPTPLPVIPLLSVFLLQLAEPITATVIYPFVNQFVRETGITRGDETKTGYYAGVIESAFFLAEGLTVVQWGYLSDRYGRRPILLYGPLGLAVAMLIFGTSTVFWPLVLSRCVAKTVIAELTDSSNRGNAYGFLPLIWAVGTTLGPLLGGVLANPEKRWSSSLGRIPYLRTHPYFLPCAVAASFALVAFMFVWLGLKETHPSFVKIEKEKKSDPVASLQSSLLEHGDGNNYGTQVTPDGTPTAQQQKPTFRSAFTRPVVVTLVNYVFRTFLDMSHFVLLPLMYSTPVEFGGLGLDPFSISIALGAFGVANSIVQVKFLGASLRKLGARTVYRASFSCFLVFFGMYPIMKHFAQRAGGVDAYVIVCMVIQLTSQMAMFAAHGSLQYILVESVPENGPLGTVNGVAQMLGSATRSIAPTFASSLFSVSQRQQLAGGNMVYYVLLGLTVLGIRCTSLLPKTSRRTSS